MAFALILVFALSSLGPPSSALRGEDSETTDERPNIVIILVDDMGFSDIGCYGSEIETPNVDRLATEGLRFTQFYNSGRCCPTRASLMT
ncbi:MAG: sulfatase-like hydrolase/transferase, partial [Planctomycetaceae bacterium]|nr:sulfatase-like hydrolase/transferase [Planctomycetaceae bacterium]